MECVECLTGFGDRLLIVGLHENFLIKFYSHLMKNLYNNFVVINY